MRLQRRLLDGYAARCPEPLLWYGDIHPRVEKSASLAALYKTHPPLDARLNHIDERGYEKLAAYTSRE